MNAHGNTKRLPSPVSLGKASMVTLSLFLGGCSPSGERALIEGDRLLQIGKSTEAIPLLERAALDLPQNAPALNHLGLAYHASGKTNEARRAYLRALEVDRNRIEATYNLAITHLERGELLEAEKGLRAYLVAHPTDAAVWEVLAQLQFQSGRWDDAERSFASIQPTGAISADGWNSRGLLSLRKRRFKDAVNCFQYALSLNPAATTPLYNLGVSHQLQGDRRSAAAQYRRWLAVNPSAPQSAAVQELVRQWETPATPPTALVSTNAPTPLVPQRPGRPTAPVAPNPRTNAVAVTEAPRPLATTTPPSTAPSTAPSTPPSSPARTPEPAAVKPVAPPQIVPPPPPPLQVVNVQEDPPLRPAQDEPVAKPAAKPVVAVPTGVAAPAPQKPTEPATSTVASPSAAEGKADATETDDANNPAKRSLWQRVTPGKWANPVQWFRKSSETNTAAASDARPPGNPAEVAAKAASKPSSSPQKKPTPLSPPAAVGLYAGELDDPAKARNHYESVLALEPSHPQAAAIRGWLASHPK